MKGALCGGTVTERAGGDRAIPAHRIRERKPDGGWYAAADDRAAPVETPCPVEDVHRPATPTAAALDVTEELGHQRARAGTPRASACPRSR